ncbi:genetic competence negative regulator [Cytobacillus horneckiae]|uniref:Adaptor protein n=1 Tax=Cytobacillus horneckiae TaxID=549687 RepID=A0A2N0ZCX8_9BACI|nr:genetic competence negative regulator [Cytobacillus horneckiae]MCM3180121.1 genetic competence negative regulator [Cytobacillus horneckiae]MEC1156566.1 genetic competence negative regulator [Cytobacillus horneckiae]MED2938909.1 genetic competence negative regulator [Cytobacillus horneckiae]PKG27344.1 adaptor protein [Cytobacillus horneckiae]
MHLERLNFNKIKIFLTLDDLIDRGLTKEDIWKDSLKWHQLFQDMLEEASEKFGVDIYGTVAVEVFSMQAQGMVMIVTMQEEAEEDEELLKEGFVDLQIDFGEQDYILYEFNDIEDVIALCKILNILYIAESTLFAKDGKYYLYVRCNDKAYDNKVIPILAEYGTLSLKSIHVLHEYGKVIIENKAIENIIRYFI